VTDSHLGLPVVEAPRTVLEADLRPFRAALDHQVDGVMTAHVAYPALDPEGAPATLSRAIVGGLLRAELGFGGLVVTDALVMAGVLGSQADEARAAVAALAAGCDVLLYPTDLERVTAALEAAGDRARLAEAAQRVAAAANRAAAPHPDQWGRPEDRAWAHDVAIRALQVVRGAPAVTGHRVDVVTVDDDLGGPFPPGPRMAFPATLAASGIEAREAGTATPERPAVIALYADIRGWKGRPHVSTAARERVARTLAVRPEASVVLFGHPRLATEIPGEAVLAAWSGDEAMQEAAARWLASRAR
jgi:hypothetical protein